MFKAVGKDSLAEYYSIPKWIEHIISMDDKDKQRLEIERMVNMIESAIEYKK
jgi:hypothetical protein